MGHGKGSRENNIQVSQVMTRVEGNPWERRDKTPSRQSTVKVVVQGRNKKTAKDKAFHRK